ncbi:hypothetical protein R1sor_018913 [Riccia sorocarpa]|uniref:Protein unc-45 homolog B n=1 Tax=Riccia sorocarpa TaxID=122646 RepID=A0ABD3IC70_9MARC
MVLAQAIQATGAIIQSVTTIQNIGNNRYKVSRSWEEFGTQIERLHHEHSLWMAKMAKKGILPEEDGQQLVARLEKAVTLFQAEESKLRSMENRSWLGRMYCLNFRAVSFPKKLNLALKDVNEALAGKPSEPKDLKEKGAIEYSSNEMVGNNVSGNYGLATKSVETEVTTTAPRPGLLSLLPLSDSKYVPLRISEAAIFQALENPAGPRVVLLHGGPGRGKSTLAKAVALRYASQLSSNAGDKTFDHVAVLHCGPRMISQRTQMELLRSLGGRGVDVEEISSTTPNILRARMKSKTILIILNDAWLLEPVQQIVELGGEGVKYLVTSEKSTLLQNALPVEIQPLGEDDAEKIFANHVPGLAGQKIPKQLQDVSDSMIKQADNNPLALASLAMTIQNTSVDDIEEWQNIAKAHSDLLKMEDANRASGFDGEIPRSVWATMKLVQQSLPSDALELLTLSSVFEGPATPESVVKLLYGWHCHKRGCKIYLFTRWRNELKSNGSMLRVADELIIDTNSADLERVSQRTWSLHNLHKSFVRIEMKLETEKLAESFFGPDNNQEVVVDIRGHDRRDEDIDSEQDSHSEGYLQKGESSEEADSDSSDDDDKESVGSNEDADASDSAKRVGTSEGSEIDEAMDDQERMILLLCAVYMDDEFSKKAANKLRISGSILESKIRRSAVEPIFELLPEHDDHSENACIRRQAIQKVVVTYLSSGELNDEGFSSLLSTSEPPAVLVITHILQTIASIAVYEEGKMLLSKKTRGILAAMSTLLEDGTIEDIQNNVLQTLTTLAVFKENHEPIISASPDLLDKLARLLGDQNPLSKQKTACLMLTSLTQGGETAIGDLDKGLLSCLKELVRLLFRKQTQLHALLPLINMARSDVDTAEKILALPEVAGEIVSMLSTTSDPRIQEHAAKALAMLGRNSADNRLKVFQQCPSCVPELLKLITSDVTYSVQVQALLALNEMENGRTIINSTPKCLSELLKLLSTLSEQPQDVQVRALEALAHQAMVDEKTSNTILSSAGAISDLVNLLSKSDLPNVQSEAARTLAFLARRSVGNAKWILLESPGCIRDLLNLLSKKYNSKPCVQLRATEALGDLAFKNAEASREILDTPSSVRKLARLLTSEVPGVRSEAARALGNLAGVPDEQNGKVMIMECPKLLDELLKLIGADQDQQAQLRAVTAIATLAFEDVELSRTITEAPGAVEGLVSSLSKTEAPELQEEAARALANLASDSVENSNLIVRRAPWCIRDLVGLLSSESSDGARSRAVEALAEMSSENEEVARDILDCPRSVTLLTELLSGDESTDNQYHTARVLANLVCESPEHVKKIVSDSPTCVADLVGLMSKDHSPDVVYQATGALGQLALVSLEIATNILEYPNIVKELVRLLIDDDRIDLQLQATEMLSILATSSLENRKALVQKEPECVPEIVRLLKSPSEDLQYGGVHLLVCLAYENEENATEILKHPGAVKEVASLLVNTQNTDIHEEVIKTLAFLASSNPDNCKLMVLETPEFVLELAKLISRDRNSDLLYQAGEALAELALSSLEVATKALEYPGIVKELTWLLANHDRVDVRLQAAVFLSILASSSVENGRTMLIQYPDCVNEVLTLISERHDVQYGSVHLLACLAFENLENSREILESPGAIEELVGLLAHDENPDVQEEAARTLAFLADCDADHGAMILEECPNTITELVRLISPGSKHKPEIQLRAVEVITALASGNIEISAVILDTRAALRSLVGLLSKSYDVYFKVQEAVATCLAFMASDSVEHGKAIFKRCPESITELVRLLSGDHDVRVQRRAAEALAELATASQEVSKTILETAEAVSRLVTLLGSDEVPEVQEEAARALTNLASENVDSGDMIVLICPEVIDVLVRLTSEDNPPEVQQRAVEALANLAFSNEEISNKLVDCPGAVEHLVNLVATSKSPAVQEAAGRSLRNLASVQAVRSAMAAAVDSEFMDALVAVFNQKGILSQKARYAGVVALTLMDPKRGDAVTLDSRIVCKARGCAKKMLGLFSEALGDFDSALRWEPKDDSVYSERMYVKAMLEDYEGALADADKALQIDPFYPFYLQERGVLKIRMGDLQGALADLNRADGDDYKTLKHRGYVKFLLKDEQGARNDAIRALRLKSSTASGAEPLSVPNDSLSCVPVKYLDFQLP